MKSYKIKKKSGILCRLRKKLLLAIFAHKIFLIYFCPAEPQDSDRSILNFTHFRSDPKGNFIVLGQFQFFLSQYKDIFC